MRVPLTKASVTDRDISTLTFQLDITLIRSPDHRLNILYIQKLAPSSATHPDFLMTEAMHRHLCKCKENCPELALRMFEQAKQQPRKEDTIRIQEEARQHLINEVRIKCLLEIRH